MAKFRRTTVEKVLADYNKTKKKPRPALDERGRDNVANRINKRIANVVKELGTNSAEYQYFLRQAKARNMKLVEHKTKIYDAATGKYSNQTILWLGRYKHDPAFTDRNLYDLDERVRTLKKAKSELTRAMRDQVHNDKYKPTLAEMQEYIDIKKEVGDWFSENDDLVYALLEETGWSNIRDHSTEEIHQVLERIRNKGPVKHYDVRDRDIAREEYRERREEDERLARGY